MMDIMLPYVISGLSGITWILLVVAVKRRKKIEKLTKMLVSRDAELGEMVTFKAENVRLKDKVHEQALDITRLKSKVQLYERLHPALSPEVLQKYDRGELTYLVPNPLKNGEIKAP